MSEKGVILGSGSREFNYVAVQTNYTYLIVPLSYRVSNDASLELSFGCWIAVSRLPDLGLM